MSDNQIIELTLAGETDAFGLLVKRWERPIYGLSLRMLGRDEDARDVCQETFMSAFRNIRKFRGDAKFSSWIYRIALNACHSKLRKRQSTNFESYIDDKEKEEIEIADPNAADVHDILLKDQRAMMVRKALMSLPAEMRQIIIMKEYEELTFAEIAEILDTPVSTVKSRLYTGLTNMRYKLDKYREAL